MRKYLRQAAISLGLSKGTPDPNCLTCGGSGVTPLIDYSTDGMGSLNGKKEKITSGGKICHCVKNREGEEEPH